ncbi:MAG TPA: FtsX-like permease family protein, partial [Thermoanaerobaculia bacterium]|nr:FtsX-like permease family protein [Thermoanaerobaculia bacterium]
ALLLAAVGTYGVASCAAAERTREVGIRVAMGARPADVLALFLREAVFVGAIGLGAGLVLAAPGMRLLEGMLFEVSAFDPVSYAGVSALLLAAVLAATLAPALRATGVDPVKALRAE